MQAKRPVRFPFNPSDIVYSANGGFHPNLPGYILLYLAEFHMPKAERFPQMLVEVREKFKWSEALLAAVCGVGLSTIRTWIEGTRKPTGAARKLIWLLHDNLVAEKKTSHNAWDLVFWGQLDCRLPEQNEEGKFDIAPTVAIPRDEFMRQAREALRREPEASSSSSAQPPQTGNA